MSEKIQHTVIEKWWKKKFKEYPDSILLLEKSITPKGRLTQELLIKDSRGIHRMILCEVKGKARRFYIEQV